MVKKAFQGKVKLGLEHMVNSCATFYDPARIYPAAIEVNIKVVLLNEITSDRR